MAEPTTEAGRRMLNIPAIRNSYSTAAWIEEIRGVEQEARAALRAELAAKVAALPTYWPPAPTANLVDRTAVLGLLRKG